jgi:ADP-heptose:LPS heptosyltransferase
MKKYLVIRRDNIGDLVCTTPLLSLILQTYPDVQLDMLVNSYNAAAVLNYPGVHRVYVYTKAKHRVSNKLLLNIYWQRLKQLIHLRQEKYDVIFFCQRTKLARIQYLAKWLQPKKIIFFAEKAKRTASEVALSEHTYFGQPEVQVVASMLTALGIKVEQIPPCRVYPDRQMQQQAQALLQQQPWYRNKRMTLAIHISARKPNQRWSVQKFSTLLALLSQQYDVQFILFWSPGSINNALHPGDDEKAQAIMEQVVHLPVLPFPTSQLEELIAGLSICDKMICSDGGAMHIAAGLGKPIVCLFGNSNSVVWHPWGVPYQLLQLPSRQVEDITVEMVMAAFARLQNEL